MSRPSDALEARLSVSGSATGLFLGLGAARRHVALQFLVEALLLALIGGLAGVLLGTGATYAVSLQRGWAPSVPPVAIAAALAAAVLIGAIAGLYPAQRAARLAPTEALRTV